MLSRPSLLEEDLLPEVRDRVPDLLLLRRGASLRWPLTHGLHRLVVVLEVHLTVHHRGLHRCVKLAVWEDLIRRGQAVVGLIEQVGDV